MKCVPCWLCTLIAGQLFATLHAASPSLPTRVQDYPWHVHAAANHTVADVGGGLGSWLAALLECEPGLRGTLVDLRSVVVAAGG